MHCLWIFQNFSKGQVLLLVLALREGPKISNFFAGDPTITFLSLPGIESGLQEPVQIGSARNNEHQIYRPEVLGIV